MLTHASDINTHSQGHEYQPSPSRSAESGSTLKAAKKLNRHGLGVEFEEETYLKTVKEVSEY